MRDTFTEALNKRIERLILIWNRAHIPEYANDAKTVIQSLLTDTAKDMYSLGYTEGAKLISDQYKQDLFLWITKRLKRDDSYKNRKVLFTREQFLEWIEMQSNFPALWTEYVKHGFRRGLAPSVDRINNEGDYSLDNIRIITVRENSQRPRKAPKERSTCDFDGCKNIQERGKYPDGRPASRWCTKHNTLGKRVICSAKLPKPLQTKHI